MSRIGRLAIPLPEKVSFSFKDSAVSISGPKGKLEKVITFNGDIIEEEKSVRLVNKDLTNEGKALYGLTRSLINNMIVGVTEGFKKTLKIVGVGFKAQVQGKILALSLGYSHTIQFPIPPGLSIETPDQNTIVVNGIDKELVGQVAAVIRKLKEPEPYKGKGIMYANEVIRRKAGKAGTK